jgi:HAMP domain-containing protein
VAAMKLLLKFNLILILVFGSGVAIAGYLSHRFLERSARAQVLEQARLMMGAAGGMRTYTSAQVGPLLSAHQQRTNGFLPQIVPAYSATEVFTYLRATYPDYSYKEASLNPTNLRNRAAEWEADVIQIFRNHPEKQEFSAERETPAGKVLFLAKPLFVDMSCLECHSTPDKAPPAMTKIYGADHGFGWNVGEAIAVQLVSVPMAIPLRIADQAFKTLMLSLGSISLVTLILFDAGIVLAVIRPVTQLARTADRISNGDLNVPELPVKGSDEIADLARSFNRMYRSLVKAIRMLESP